MNIEELPIVKKAYKVNFSKIDEGYLAAPTITHANTANEAKKLLLKEVVIDGWKLLSSGEELSYLNIPIARCPGADLVMFENTEVPRYSVIETINERKRNSELDVIANNPNIRFCYICKGIYYRPNASGYTSHLHEAGVYEKMDAIAHAKHCREITLVPIDEVVHNDMITARIAGLQSRIIPPLQ